MKNIRFLSAISALLLLSSCSLDPPEIPASELYLRGFIKKFGLIDPSQTWNQAISSEVTLIATNPVTEGSVFACRDDKFYRVANLRNVSGKVTIPIDIALGVSELKLELDGEVFFTRVGGTIDNADPASRTFTPEGSAQSTVSAEKRITITDNADVKVVPFSQVKEIFTLLPEEGPLIPGTTERLRSYPGNLDADGIITDFLLYSGDQDEPKEVTIFPVYWNTCQTHTLGVYYFDGAVENRSTIVKVPFYTMRKSPEFEDIRMAHTSTNGALDWDQYPYYTSDYDYTVAANQGAPEGPARIHDNTTSWQLPVEQNLLKFGGCPIVPNEGDFYVVHRNHNSGNETRCGGSADYLGNRRYDDTEKTEGVDDYYYKLPIDAGDQGSQVWDNQFRIHTPYPLQPGQTVRLRFKYKANKHPVPTAIPIQLESSEYGYIANAPEIPVNDGVSMAKTWKTYDQQITIPYRNGKTVDLIDICLGNRQWAEDGSEGFDNIYCFEDIELLSKDYVLPVYGRSYNAYKNYRSATAESWTYETTYEDQNGQLQENLTHVSDPIQNSGANYMGNAHLLIRKDASSSATYCPLADVQGINRTECYDINDPYYVQTTGIKIAIPPRTHYGFYIDFTDLYWPYDPKTVYSEAKGNWENLTENKGWCTYDLQTQRRYITYSAIFEQEIDVPGGSGAPSRADGKQKFTYLTFEDWTPHSQLAADKKNQPVGDYDLNDLAFMVTGIDNLEEEVVTNSGQFEFLICAEDLGTTDDFDFNDMIVGVKTVTEVEGSDITKQVTFTALAGGGTLPLYLHCKYNYNGQHDETLCPDGQADPEWHRWFGINDSGEMINTFNHKRFYRGASCTITTDGTFKLSNFGRIGNGTTTYGSSEGISGIYITVNSEHPAGEYDIYQPGRYISGPDPGNAPQMFLIEDKGYDGGPWRWPAERAAIEECYQYFQNWAALPAWPIPDTPPTESNANYHNYYWYIDEPQSAIYLNRR